MKRKLGTCVDINDKLDLNYPEKVQLETCPVVAVQTIKAPPPSGPAFPRKVLLES